MSCGRLLLGGLLLLAVLVSPGDRACAQASLSPTGFRVGQSFPNLALPSLEDGRPVSLTDFRGQKLILHVFASW